MEAIKLDREGTTQLTRLPFPRQVTGTTSVNIVAHLSGLVVLQLPNTSCWATVLKLPVSRLLETSCASVHMEDTYL